MLGGYIFQKNRRGYIFQKNIFCIERVSEKLDRVYRLGGGQAPRTPQSVRLKNVFKKRSGAFLPFFLLFFLKK